MVYTIAQAAKLALDVQDACNLSGVLASFKQIMHETICPLNLDTHDRNRHPIAVLFISKMGSLNGGYYECDYMHASEACERMAAGEDHAIVLAWYICQAAALRAS